MPIIAIQSVSDCNSEKIAILLAMKLKYDYHSDDIFQLVESKYNIYSEKFKKAFYNFETNFSTKDIEKELLKTLIKFKIQQSDYEKIIDDILKSKN